MKISYQWLQEFVDLSDVTPEQVAEKLTLHTAEVEEVIPQAPYYQDILTGKLLSIKPHPDSEKLSVAQFDLGEKGEKQIIFGKVHELKEGEILPIVLPGGTLKSGIEIKSGEIRGVMSEGMICDNAEMGMKNGDLIRFESSTPLGKPLTEIIESCRDTLIDIDNKSLTHRPDLMGHRGFARELSAIFDRKLLLPEPLVGIPKSIKSDFEIEIETDQCRRFCALGVEKIQVKASPINFQLRLEHLGIRAISNMVDITNFVMLGYGQPMHVFDADKIQGDLIVRQACPGESLVALDGEEYELTPEDTVVADSQKVLSIAGVMGGLESGATASTTNIIFESANWDPVAVRKTSQRLGLRSDSSMRYEKSLDPETNKRAIFAATEQALELSPEAEISTPFIDQYTRPFDTITIQLNPQLVRDRSGLSINDTSIKKRLESIGFIVSKNGKEFNVEVPSFRATKDVSIEEDLIEEVVRLEGFESIEAALPQIHITPPQTNYGRALEWAVRDNLEAQGFLESYGYSFVDEKESVFSQSKNYIEIANPLSSEHQFLRQTLTFNAINSIESELRTHGALELFEIGKAYIPTKEVLANEENRTLLLKASMGASEDSLFYELKNNLKTLFKTLGIQNVEYVPLETISYLHPTKSATIKAGGQEAGFIGVIHPSYSPVKKSAVVVSEISLDTILEIQQSSETEYQKIVSYPSVRRDLSIVVGEKTLMSDLIRSAKKSTQILSQIELFDEYRDEEKLGKELKNLSFHLSFRSDKKTLDEGEIEAALTTMISKLQDQYGAQLRADFDEGKK